MAQPPTQADGGSSTDPRPALEDAAIVIHADGYDLIEIGDVKPTESEAVQERIDELPEDPGGAAFNADAHPDHSSVELVDATYPFDVAATLRLAHVESGRFDVLGDDQLVRCVNPKRESLTWFYEADDDGMVAECHEIDDFEAGTIERSKALASIASESVDVSIVGREELEERRERGEAVTDGGSNPDDPKVYSEGDRIVATANDGTVKGEWQTMKRLAKTILSEAEEHKTDLQKAKDMAAGVHIRLSCECCGFEDEAEYARDLVETPEEHVEHPDFDCTPGDVTIEAFCPRHGTVPFSYDECDSCASDRALMNR